MIHVLIADDHPVVRRGFRQILSETHDIVVDAEASSGPEVLSLLNSKAFDVLVLDINLGITNGLELLADIRKQWPRLPVIILTISPESHYAIRAVRTGASGFLTKELAPERLIDAVRKVAVGGRYLTPSVAEQLAAHVAQGEPDAPHRLLSNRELQVLQLLGSGKTVSEIARGLNLSVKTISTHRARLLAKMGMKTTAELTHYAVKSGLVQ